MKNILLLLFALPVTVFAQLKTVSFNIDNFPAKMDEQSVSADLATFLGISGEFAFEQEKNKKTVTNKRNERHVTYQQYYHGFPIEHTAIKLHYRNDKLYYINGEYLPAIAGNSFSPKLTEKEAFESAKKNAGAKEFIWDRKESMAMLPENSSTELLFPAPHAQLVILCIKTESGSNACLTYKFDIYATVPLSRNYVYVNASTGQIMAMENRISNVVGTADTKYSGEREIGTDAAFGHFRLRDYDSDRGNGIETFNMQNGSDYWGAMDFADDDNDWTAAEFDNANMDNIALDVHWGGIMTYDYFFNVHGRNSIDDNGMVLQGFVHCDLNGLNPGISNNANAYWDGTRANYGDGDGDYGPWTSIDVVAHEIGHGLCAQTAAVAYGRTESGAINESLSDIWGACVENYATNDKETWLFAEDVLLSSPYYERSLSDPKSGIYNQPDTYEGEYWGDLSYDPHINSGVMNHWFYLLAEGGSGTNDNNDDFDVAGIGIEDAAQIVFLAETEYMTSGTNYASARIYTIQAAQDIFGNCSQQVRSVIDAWHAVGVGSSFEIFDEKHITVNVSPSTVQDVFAVTLLEASNIIGASSTIRYQSSGEVVLSPEFSTDGATNFVAEIIPCIDLQNGKKDNLKDNTASVIGSKPAKKENDLSVKIFPNPTADILGILFHTDKVENAQVTISDANSRVVKSFAVSSKHNEVKIDELAAGFYFINIQYNGKVFSSKIIKN